TSIPKLDAKTNDGTKRLRGRALPDGSHLIEAEVLAGGFLRIRRSALERFRSAYPNDWYKEPSTNPDEPERRYTKFFAAETVNGTFNGEDHYFSKKIRDMGTQMFIFPNVTLGHWGYNQYDGNFHKFISAKEIPEKAMQSQQQPQRVVAS